MFKLLLCEIVVLLSFLLPLTAHAVHPCGSAALTDSNCISLGTRRPLPTSGPIATSFAGQVIEGKRFTSTTGHCITINHANVIVRNNEIGPCSSGSTPKHGVALTGGASNANIRNNYMHGTPSMRLDVGIFSIAAAADVTIYMNKIERARKGIGPWVGAARWTITHNYFLDLNPSFTFLDGQAVQFNHTTSGAQTFSCNVVDFTPGSRVGGAKQNGDYINVFESSGTEANPIVIRGNKVHSGEDAHSASVCINPSDCGPSGGLCGHVRVRENICWSTDSARTGPGTAGGYNVTLHNNRICGTTIYTSFIRPFGIQNAVRTPSEKCVDHVVSYNSSGLRGNPGGSFGQILTAPSCTTTFTNNTIGDTRLDTDAECKALFNGPSLEITCNACSDRVDNDGDGFTDFPTDKGCTSAFANRE